MDQKEQLYNSLKEAFILLDIGDRWLFNQFNLTPPRFYALLHIYEEPGASSTYLSGRMFCDKSNMTRIVKSLEAEGYIQRQPHETDGRAMRLYLTEAGQALLRKVQTAHRAYNAARLDCMDEITQGDLLKNLATLIRSLQAELHAEEHSTNGRLP